MENTVTSPTATVKKPREAADNNKVLQIDLTTGAVLGIWESPYKASEGVNHSCKRIKMTCRGEVKKAGGFFWCYASEALQAQYNVRAENFNK